VDGLGGWVGLDQLLWLSVVSTERFDEFVEISTKFAPILVTLSTRLAA